MPRIPQSVYGKTMEFKHISAGNGAVMHMAVRLSGGREICALHIDRDNALLMIAEIKRILEVN